MMAEKLFAEILAADASNEQEVKGSKEASAASSPTRREASTWRRISCFQKSTSAEVERHIPIVRRMIELYGYGELLDYEEKLASGMLGVAFALETFDPSRNVKFAYWLAYQVDKSIRNDARVALRQRRRYVQPLEERFDPIDASGWERAISADARRNKEALQAIAVDALDALDPKLRLVVTRIVFEGRTQEEVGRELGCSQSWASRLTRAAIRKLRRLVEARAAELGVEIPPNAIKLPPATRPI